MWKKSGHFVDHECGHRQKHFLSGNLREREYLGSRLAGQSCSDCIAETARDDADSHGLPRLTGSSKQVAWADQIRDQLFLKTLKTLQLVAADGEPEHQAAARLLSDYYDKYHSEVVDRQPLSSS